MKVLQILLLTTGLLVLGSILSITSAQNSSNSNTGSNLFKSKTNSNTNTAVPTKTGGKDEESNEDYPIVLKQISMVRKVTFPKNGTVNVQIIEEIGQPFTIRFVNKYDETVASFVMRKRGGGYIREYWESAIDPKASLKVIDVEGFPSPLVHLAMVQPGGSDYGFWSALFGEVGGKIKLLTPPTTSFSWEGGIHLGELGKGNGVGIGLWNSIWGDGESHYGDHYYQVEFFNFNQKLGKFVKTKTIKTKTKQESPAKALESLGLSFFHDRFRDFPEFLEYREKF
jgi:hypothetical protein